jgi:hypothetical protein
VKHGLRQPPTDPDILDLRIDGNRTDASNAITLAQKIAGDNAVAHMGHDFEDARMIDELPNQSDRAISEEGKSGGDIWLYSALCEAATGAAAG